MVLLRKREKKGYGERKESLAGVTPAGGSVLKFMNCLPSNTNEAQPQSFAYCAETVCCATGSQ